MTFFFILFILYIITSLFLVLGNYRINFKKSTVKPFVTVIVPARNEEITISDCLNSLANLNYTKNQIEIFIVNDRSTDNTDVIIKKFIKNHHHFKYLHIKKSNSQLSGKANAISHAIEQSKGEIIFITDADCVVQSNWILNAVTYFSEKIGVVAGFTLTQSINKKSSLFEKIQSLDLLYLLSVASGIAAWKIPLSCIGNNFAFRRQAYDDVNGYEGVGFSLTEDFALLQAIDQQTKWQTVFPIDSSFLVYSKQLKNIKDFLQQRKRWATGGLQIRYIGKFFMALSVATHIAVLISIIFSYKIFYTISVITLADLMLISFSSLKLKRLSLLLYYPLFKTFQCFYSLMLPILFITDRKIVWKEITYFK